MRVNELFELAKAAGYQVEKDPYVVQIRKEDVCVHCHEAQDGVRVFLRGKYFRVAYRSDGSPGLVPFTTVKSVAEFLGLT